jgi:predicted RNA-binding protein with PUA-like domain
MRTGDLAFFYHTGKEKRIVGVVKIVSDPYIEADTGCPVIDIAPVRALPVPVTLAQLKQDPFFAAWHLVRIPRLSVMSVPPDIWERVMAFTGTEGMDL